MRQCAAVRFLGCFRTDPFARLFNKDCEGHRKSLLPVLFSDLFHSQQITTNDAYRAVGELMSGAVLVHHQCQIGQELGCTV